MSRKVILFSFFLALLSVGLLLRSKEKILSQTDTSSYETKEESLGEITITVTPIRLSSRSQPRFEVKFDTHSVELGFDIVKIVSLTNQEGETFGEASWEGSGPGRHHREGTLSFEKLIGRESEISLTFSGILGETRTFSWQIK